MFFRRYQEKPNTAMTSSGGGDKREKKSIPVVDFSRANPYGEDIDEEGLKGERVSGGGGNDILKIIFVSSVEAKRTHCLRFLSVKCFLFKDNFSQNGS